jgi:hypothetical protein
MGFGLCVGLLLICYVIVLVCMGHFGPVLQARQRPAGGSLATLAGTFFLADLDTYEVDSMLCVSLLLLCYAAVLVCMGRLGSVLQARQRPAGGSLATLGGPSSQLIQTTLRCAFVMFQLVAVTLCCVVDLLSDTRPDWLGQLSRLAQTTFGRSVFCLRSVVNVLHCC